MDAEDSDEYTIQVIASDGIHEAITDLTVRIVDVNDNQPKFQQAAYIATLSGNLFIVGFDMAAFSYLFWTYGENEEGEKFDK